MASRLPLTRFSITAAPTTHNRVAYITRRNLLTEASTKEFASKRKGVEEHSKSSSSLWKKVSLIVVPVALIGTSANALMIMQQHSKHHHEAHTDNPQYSYQKIRTKPFFWGDGNHTPFHNTAVNGP